MVKELVEIRTRMVPVQVEAQCPVCPESPGMMVSTGSELTSNPPLYQHQCSKCGAKANLRKSYPTAELIPETDL